MRQRQTECAVCAGPVEKVSGALCQKLFPRETKKRLCLACLSHELEVGTDELLDMAEEFKQEGCPFFQ